MVLRRTYRPWAREWPDLVHDSDYSFCNQLGAEAKALGIGGLAVPSALHEMGANLPIFVRNVLSDPQLDEVVAVTYRVESDDVTVARKPQR